MGMCMGGTEQKQEKMTAKDKKPEIEKVDEVKFKLKKARDTIKHFVSAKNRDLSQIEQKIQEKVPSFKETGNKKQILPLLKAKKDILKMIEGGQTRLKVVNEKIDEVQMQKINAETIDALQDSNKYIKDIQNELERKDWQNVLAEAKQKTDIQWPEDEIEQDPEFQAMWKELGGDKVVKEEKRQVQKRKISVDTNVQQKPIKHQKQVNYA